MRNDNNTVVNHFLDKFVSSGKNVFVSSFNGVPEEEVVLLRRDLDRESAEYRVLKNRLMNVIVKKSGVNEADSNHFAKVLKGSSSFTIGGSDSVAVAKALLKFSEKNEKFVIKGGLLDGRYITADQVKDLARLPSRTELLAKFVGTINAPISGFVNVLAGSLRNIVGVIDAIRKQKEENGVQ